MSERLPRVISGKIAFAYLPTGTSSSTVAPGDLPTAVKTTGGGQEAVAAITATGSTCTVDLAAANVWTLTLNTNTALTITGTAASKACSVELYIVQGTTGGWNVTWPTSVKWPGGSPPVLSATVGAEDLVILGTRNNGLRWTGNLAGLDYK